jgi:hypothetical protein
MKIINKVRKDPLLSSDSVKSGRSYVAPVAYACTVTSHNSRRGDAGGVLCGPAPRLYDSTDRFQFSASECSAVEGSAVEC